MCCYIFFYKVFLLLAHPPNTEALYYPKTNNYIYFSKPNIMKIITLFFALFLSLNAFTDPETNPTITQSDYDKGWADGWCEGWKDVKGQYAYCPYTPYPPYPEYSCSEGYRCGYNRGFKYGMCMAQERNCEK